jgi:hypothetical protein
VFTVQKKSGRWVMDDSTIHDQESIVMIEPIPDNDNTL